MGYLWQAHTHINPQWTHTQPSTKTHTHTMGVGFAGLGVGVTLGTHGLPRPFTTRHIVDEKH